MKKYISFFLCGLLIFSPYSLDFKALANSSGDDSQSIGFDNVDESGFEESPSTSPSDNELIIVSNEEDVSESLQLQISSIENAIERIESSENAEAFSELIEEINTIDLPAILAEDLINTQENLEIDNIDSIIEEINPEDSSADVRVNGEEQSFLSKNKVDAEDSEDNIVDEEFDYETSTEGETSLIDSSVSLNVIMEDGEDTVIKTIEDVANELEEDSFSFSDFFKKNVGNAKDSGFGYFVATHKTVVANEKTNNAKVISTGTILLAGGVLKPTRYTIELKNKVKTSSSSSAIYTNLKHQKFFNATMKKDYYIESPISKTYFWSTEGVFEGTFKDGSTDSDRQVSKRALINKKGVKYPVFKDPKSGKVMSEPSSTEWVKKYYPESWSKTKRDKYIKWYDSEYGKLTWADYEIHHIRPRVRYGSNEYSNLIPLKRSYHRSVVNPWWTNY